MQVEKRDGRLEEFDREKIAQSVAAAGLEEEEAESLASEVEAWAQDVAEDDVISTLKIRNRVIELLRERDPEAAARFEEYKKE